MNIFLTQKNNLKKRLFFISKTRSFSDQIKSQNQNVVKRNTNKTIKYDLIFSIHQDRHSVHSYKKYEVSEIEYKPNKTYGLIKPHYIFSKEELTSKTTFIQKKIKGIKRVFLPKDYPYSVSKEYFDFSKYNFIGGVSFFYLNFLFTLMTIESLGVSTRTSSITSAGLNWALKEGFGQIVSFITVAKFGVLAEKNVKEYRVISSILLHMVFILELMILINPKYFVLLAGMSTLIKLTAVNMSVISRTGIHLQMAKKNNLIDLSIKHQNQNNIALFIGTVLGYITSIMIKLDFTSGLMILTISNILNILLCKLTYKKLIMNDFNYQRLFIFSKKFLTESRLLNPIEVSRFERFLFYKPTIKFCSHSVEFLMKQDRSLVIRLLKVFDKENFIVYPKHKFNLMTLSLHRKYHIYTFLKLEASNLDILKAFFFTVRLEEVLNFSNKYTDDELIDYINETKEYLNKILTEKIFLDIDKLDWVYNFYNIQKNWSRYQTHIKVNEVEK